MDNEQYIPSKFNFCFKDDKNKLFLYNFYKGIKSLAVIEDSKESEMALKILLQNDMDSASNEFVKKMYERGYLIQSTENEMLKVQHLYMKQVMKSELNLTIMPTEKCNFRCSYCYEDYEKGTMSLENQQALLKFVQKNIKKYNSLHVGWFGGEPLIAYDAIKNLSQSFMKICKNANRKYTASITTNGYYLTPEIFQELCGYHIYFYQITLDGLKEQHDKQRFLANGQGTFDVIMNNLNKIKQFQYINHILPNIMIRMNFTKEIYDNLDRVIQFFGDNFSSHSMFSFLFRKVGDYGGDKVHLIKEKMMNEEVLSKIYKRVYESPYQFNIDTQLSMLGEGGQMCYANKQNHFVIGSDCTIYKCTVDFENSRVGYFQKNGELHLDEYRVAEWCAKSSLGITDKCGECVQLPSCLNASCTKSRVCNESKCIPYSQELIEWIIKCYDKANPITVLS